MAESGIRRREVMPQRRAKTNVAQLHHWKKPLRIVLFPGPQPQDCLGLDVHFAPTS
jgi:hypothetical protein